MITEEQAIRRLKSLAKVWPDTLWLFSAAGSLCVMRNGDDGRPVHKERRGGGGGGVDPDYLVDTIRGLPNDGGDW